VNNVVAVQILDTFQDLLRVAAENLFLQSSKPRQNVGDGTSGHELHEDADDVVFQTGAKIPEQGTSTGLMH